jgi:hypothetical protein
VILLGQRLRHSKAFLNKILQNHLVTYNYTTYTMRQRKRNRKRQPGEALRASAIPGETSLERATRTTTMAALCPSAPINPTDTASTTWRGTSLNGSGIGVQKNRLTTGPSMATRTLADPTRAIPARGSGGEELTLTDPSISSAPAVCSGCRPTRRHTSGSAQRRTGSDCTDAERTLVRCRQRRRQQRPNSGSAAENTDKDR